MARQVATSDALVAAFRSAQDGNTIALAPGIYDRAVLSGRDFTAGLTITSADPEDRAIFTHKLQLRDVGGVTLTGLDIAATEVAPSFSHRYLEIGGSRRVTVADLTLRGHIPTSSEGVDPESAGRKDVIAGHGYATGAFVRDARDITFQNVSIADVRQAISINDTAGTVLRGVEIFGVREGVNVWDIDRILIEDSWFHDFKPWNMSASGDHADMFQYWGVNSQSGVHNVTIRNNLFEQPEGVETQTVFGHMRTAPAGVTARGFEVSGNLIVNGHPNAIRLHGVTDVEIFDNVLIPSGPGIERAYYPTILLIDVRGGRVTGNMAVPRWTGEVVIDADDLRAAGVTVAGNIPLRDDPSVWAELYEDAVEALDEIAR